MRTSNMTNAANQMRAKTTATPGGTKTFATSPTAAAIAQGFRRVSSKIAGPVYSTKAKKKIPRLNAMELQALFRRLDVNGSGDLSYTEFRAIISKLNLSSPSVMDSLHDVFKQADTVAAGIGGVGSLNIKEFMNAYDILYNRLISDTGPSQELDPKANWVRATRYGYFGRDEHNDKKYIFECYTGPMHDISTKYIYELPNVVDNDDPDYVPEAIDVSTLGYATCSLTNYNIETLNRLILEDGERNIQYDARIMWWVDICSKERKESEITSIIKAFGLPEDIRDNMTELKDGHMHFGMGEVVCESIGKTIQPKAYLGNASFLSFFVNGLFVRNKPVVDRDPEWVRDKYGIGEYISSRLALFYNMSRAPCNEVQRIISSVHERIGCLLDAPIDERANNTVETPNCDVNIPSSPHQTTLPVPVVTEPMGASWLLNVSDMRQRKPCIHNSNISLHLQDQGYGPIALITVRKQDSDLIDTSTKFWSQDQHSRAGIVGHIFAGLWLKLLEVTANEGVVNVAADLDDSTFSLALSLMSFIHDTSMLTSDSLDSWVAQLALEIEEIAVTKHSKHIEKLEELLSTLKNYVDNFNDAFLPLIRFYNHKKHREETKGKRRRKPTFHDDVDHFGVGSSIVNFHRAQNAPSPAPLNPIALAQTDEQDELRELQSKFHIDLNYCYEEPEEILELDMNNIINPHRTDGNVVLAETKHLRSKDPYEESEYDFTKLSVEQKCQIIEYYAMHDTMRRLPELTKGVDKLGLKGTVYWFDRIETVKHGMAFIRERYQMMLDEKRNFWAFTLGIVSIATFPFSVLTGYFGMNFENMAYPGAILTDTFWPVFPGDKMIWFVSFVIYTLMLMFALHYQVFYSAS